MGLVSKYIITEEMPIIDVLKVIDEGANCSAFVCDGGKLLASVTDGDIRRYLLRGGDLTLPISLVANYSPAYVYEEESADYIELMNQKGIKALPVVDKQHNIMRIEFLNYSRETGLKAPLKLPVIIMAGGKGTRLYPYTKILPKPLIPIGDIPISEMIINEFCRYGCNQFYLIVNHKKNMIKAYFNEIEKPYHVEYVDEEKPLGTGGGLSLLKGRINGTFILTNCDVLIKADLIDAYKQHQKQKNKITMVCCKKKLEIPYGVVEENENNELLAMTEKPSMTLLMNAGVYFIESEIIEELVEGQKIDFPDIINECKLRGERVGVFSVEGDEWLDMGQIDEMEKMKEKLGI